MARVTSLEAAKNSAARIANILIRTIGQSSGAPSYDVWRVAFQLDATADAHTIAELLMKMRKEVESTERILAASDVPPHLYKFALAAVTPMLALNNLSQSWGSISAGTSQDCILAFRWAAFILPDEAQQIDSADLEELKDLIAEFEMALADAILPPVLHAYLSDQVGRMKAAISSATVCGTSDIKAAVRNAVSEAHFNGEELKQEAADVENPEEVEEVKSKFLKLFKKGAEMAGDLEKFEKGFKVVGSTTGWVIELIKNSS